MNFAGFTLETYIFAGLLLFVAGCIAFAPAPKMGDKSSLAFLRKPLTRTLVSAFAVAAVAGLLFIPSTHMVSTEGTVVSVEAHGDGSSEGDYSVINTDQANVALVVMRSDMPEVSQGDTVKLRCNMTNDDKVYLCNGSVSSASKSK